MTAEWKKENGSAWQPGCNMHRFFAEFKGEEGEIFEMSREDAAHAVRVLRLMPGDEVEAVSPPLRALASIVSTDAQGVTLRLVRLLPSSEMRTHLTLYQGLPKADKMEWIVQKGVELGCSRFVPVELTRSVVQADRGEKGEKKTERLRKIAREAVKQSGRTAVPEITRPLRLKEAKELLAGEDIVLVPWEEENSCTLLQALEGIPRGAHAGLLIGPEGGITPEEIEELRKLGNIRVITLGPRILRTETAAIATLAAMACLFGEWERT